ncbi:MAG: hypothetical protein IIY21_26030 [Clostridiales bacterium]|nr:hypothetical protein [Clostridiales bacterium]
MKEVSKTIKYKDQEYKLVFNLNVMEAIQEEYKTLDNWSKLTDGSGADGEPNIKALKFGLTAMLNEGIEIENETRAEKRDLLTDKQVGRIISEMGLENLTADMNGVVIDSVKSDDSKNA